MANLARYDDLNTGAIAYATLVSCIVLLIVILLVRALCCAWVEGEEQRKTLNAHYYTSDTEISEQKARVSGYGTETLEIMLPPGPDGTQPAPQEVERIHIPVEKAKEVLMQELAIAEPNA